MSISTNDIYNLSQDNEVGFDPEPVYMFKELLATEATWLLGILIAMNARINRLEADVSFLRKGLNSARR